MKNILSLMFFLTFLPINAQLLLHEPFSYVSNPVNGLAMQSSGSWTKINTGDSILVGSGSLSYPGVAASTGNKVTFDAGGSDYYRTFAPQTSGTIYASFILNVPALGMLDPMGSYGMNFIESNSTSVFAACVWFQTSMTPGKYVIGISNKSSGSMPIYSGTEMNVNENYFVVISYTINPGSGNDVSKMWINPTQFGGTEPMAMYVSTGGTDVGTAGLGRFLLRQANNTLTPYVEFDELRIGTSWSTVTPQFVAPCQTYDTITTSACSSLTLNGQTYNSSGTYTQTLLNTQGCDSIITLNLTINNASTSSVSVVNCGTYNWFNQDYTSSGLYSHIITNSQGCDSIITLDLTIQNPISYYLDADQDGFGNDATVTFDCIQPSNTVMFSGDCDDNNNSIYPGAPELCDGFDNNCNGQNDEGLTFIDYYLDTDNDGFGIGTPENSCVPLSGYSIFNGDCDDTNNAVYPNATETEGNGIDENCDGVDGYLGLADGYIDVSLINVDIVPNPSNGSFSLNFDSEMTDVLVQITDMSGKTLFQSNMSGSSIPLNQTQLKPGTYLVYVQMNQQSKTLRLVIQ